MLPILKLIVNGETIYKRGSSFQTNKNSGLDKTAVSNLYSGFLLNIGFQSEDEMLAFHLISIKDTSTFCYLQLKLTSYYLFDIICFTEATAQNFIEQIEDKPRFDNVSYDFSIINEPQQIQICRLTEEDGPHLDNVLTELTANGDQYADSIYDCFDAIKSLIDKDYHNEELETQGYTKPVSIDDDTIQFSAECYLTYTER